MNSEEIQSLMKHLETHRRQFAESSLDDKPFEDRAAIAENIGYIVLGSDFDTIMHALRNLYANVAWRERIGAEKLQAMVKQANAEAIIQQQKDKEWEEHIAIMRRKADEDGW